MIARYTRPAMGAIWTEENQYKSWLTVELVACEAWSKLGVIPAEDVEKLYRNARFDIQRIHEIEAVTRHDVVAFTRAVSETLGEERKWIHYGLTSSDVVDTALAYRLKQANQLLMQGIDSLLNTLAERAHEHKHTLMIGRTHGIHAEPTSFGLKLALYYTEMQRNRERFLEAAQTIEVGKISGAVGTFAHTPPEVEAYVCEKLGLTPEPISTQVVQRDRHARYLSTLALIGTSLEKIATEIRHLQRTEVREVEEAFGKGQKGSSAMPHKRNPIGSENISGCARLLRGYMLSAYENVALWHERDILPDATILLDYMLHRLTGILQQLVVYPEHMKDNLERTHGLIYSQRLLLMLIEKGLSREEAYDRVQPLAMQAWESGISFKTLVMNEPAITAYLSPEAIEEAFDPTYHLRHIDTLFKRAGLPPQKERSPSPSVSKASTIY